MKMTAFLNDPFMNDNVKSRNPYSLKQTKSFPQNYNDNNNEKNKNKYMKANVKNYPSKNLFEYNNAHAEGYFFSKDNMPGIQNWESYHNYYRGNVATNNYDYVNDGEWEDVITYTPSNENKEVLHLTVTLLEDVKKNNIDDAKSGKILNKPMSSKTIQIRQPKKYESKLNEIIRKAKPLMLKLNSKNIRERQFLKRLFKKEVNERGYLQKTALHESAKNKKCPPSITRLLLQWGSDVDAKDANKCTALHYASKTGNTQKVYALIKNDANVNALNKNRLTPLHIACQYGHFFVAKMLLENGAWVNVKNWYDYTPLHFACENYCDKMVYLLLHYEAHLFARTVFGKTPLLRAVKFGNVGDVALLLETDFFGYPFDKYEWTYILLNLPKRVKKQTYFDAPKHFLMKF